MFLGQLYYFEKELNRVSKTQPDFEQLLEIDLAGVDKNFLNQLKSLSNEFEIGNKLKDEFISNYRQILIENGLINTLSIWDKLTGAINQPENNNKQNLSNFQNNVTGWINNGTNLLTLQQDVLLEGQFNTSEEDFALFYGLQVLNLILNITSDPSLIESDQDYLISSISTDIESLNFEPEFLIVAGSYTKPLFKHINCVFIEILEDDELILNQIQQTLNRNLEIKLVLVSNQTLEKKVKNLIRSLSSRTILVGLVDLKSDIETGYFDSLVRQTLGIKLQ